MLDGIRCGDIAFGAAGIEVLSRRPGADEPALGPPRGGRSRSRARHPGHPEALDGARVVVARDAASAAELCRGSMWSLAVLDHGLPDGDGLDVLRTLRESSPRLPILMLNGRLGRAGRGSLPARRRRLRRQGRRLRRRPRGQSRQLLDGQHDAPRCLIADDHPALLTAVASYLAANGFDLVGTAADGSETLYSRGPRAGRRARRLPHAAARRCRAGRAAAGDCAPNAVLVYTADAREAEVSELGAGAHGVVLKEAPLVDLVRALNAVLDGRCYVDPAYAGLGGRAGERPSSRRESPRCSVSLRKVSRTRRSESSSRSAARPSGRTSEGVRAPRRRDEHAGRRDRAPPD